MQFIHVPPTPASETPPQQIPQAPSVSLKVGLATIPISLERMTSLAWIRSVGKPGSETPAEFWQGLDSWMEDRTLDVLCVLCSYHKGKKSMIPGKKAGSRHLRQLLALVRSPKGLEADAEELALKFWKGLEEAEELHLERLDLPLLMKGGKVPAKQSEKHGASNTTGELRSNNTRVRVYQQHNVQASRKTIAPLIRRIIESKGSNALDDAASIFVPAQFYPYL